MTTIAFRHAAGVGLTAIALFTGGCSDGKSVDTSAPPQVGAKATTTLNAPAPPTTLKLIGKRQDRAVRTVTPSALSR